MSSSLGFDPQAGATGQASSATMQSAAGPPRRRPCDVGDTLIWGLLATGLLTTLLRVGQALHLTRMDTTLLLGTIVTPDRDRAKVIGFIIHFINGWWIALI